MGSFFLSGAGWGSPNSRLSIHKKKKTQGFVWLGGIFLLILQPKRIILINNNKKQ